jgi:glutathionyl-hydroquinone reductase
MITSEFDEWGTGPFSTVNLFPTELRPSIEDVNSWVFPSINQGITKAGYAKTQVIMYNTY